MTSDSPGSRYDERPHMHIGTKVLLPVAFSEDASFGRFQPHVPATNPQTEYGGMAWAGPSL